jgi:DNA-binding response OmpR family regulator
MNVPQDTPMPLTGLAVLVVEDDPIIAFDICDILRAAGASIVGPCTKLDKAIGAAGTAELHAAILDIRLGSQSVYPVAECLLLRAVPIVFYTGHGRQDALKKHWPGCEALRKPVTPAALVEAVSTAVSAKMLPFGNVGLTKEGTG